MYDLTDATKQKHLEHAAALVCQFKVRELAPYQMSISSYQRPVDSKFTEPKPLVICHG